MPIDVASLPEVMLLVGGSSWPPQPQTAAYTKLKCKSDPQEKEINLISLRGLRGTGRIMRRSLGAENKAESALDGTYLCQ